MRSLFGNRVVAILGLSAAVLMVAGCNDSEPLPPGSKVAIAPTEKQWEVIPNMRTDPEGNEFCLVESGNYQDELVVITLKDGDDRPIGGTDLTVSLNLSGNTYSGQSVVELYEDRNGDYIPDEGELVSGAGDRILVTRTGKYDGAKNLIVRMTLSCPYKAQMMVTAGGYTATSTFEVVEL